MMIGALAGCFREPDVVGYREKSFAVHAVLAAGDERAAVVLTRFTPGQMELPERVAGATVRLTRGGQTLELREAASGPPRCAPGGPGPEPGPDAHVGCYTTEVPGGVQPGERWTLEARFPGGPTATGVVVVPEPPALSEPADGLRVPVSNRGEPIAEPNGELPVLASVPLGWSAPAGTGRLEVVLRARAAFAGVGAVPQASCMLNGFSPGGIDVLGSTLRELRLYAVDCHTPTPPGRVAWDSIDAELVMTAFDSAYARYVRELDRFEGNDAIRPEHATAGVVGAYGLFAGAATVRRRLLLIAVD